MWNIIEWRVKIMARTLRDNQASWDALFYAIITGCTAKDALLAMGICPDSENNLARRTEREAKNKWKDMKYRKVIWVGSMENTSFLKAKANITKHF